MKVPVMPIIGDALGAITKNLENKHYEQEIRGRIENIQTTALLNQAWFGWVWFYGISPSIGYITPNSFLYI